MKRRDVDHRPSCASPAKDLAQAFQSRNWPRSNRRVLTGLGKLQSPTGGKDPCQPGLRGGAARHSVPAAKACARRRSSTATPSIERETTFFTCACRHIPGRRHGRHLALHCPDGSCDCASTGRLGSRAVGTTSDLQGQRFAMQTPPGFLVSATPRAFRACRRHPPASISTWREARVDIAAPKTSAAAVRFLLRGAPRAGARCAHIPVGSVARLSRVATALGSDPSKNVANQCESAEARRLFAWSS